MSSGTVPEYGRELTRLEQAYSLLAPLVFHGVHTINRLWGACSEELQSRCGLVPPASQGSIWFHGASAGEMSAAQNLSSFLGGQGFSFSSIYTATNRAGLEFIRRTDSGANISTWVPWDTASALNRAFERWQPKAVFLVETELWPRLVYESYRRGTPVFSVSSRLYPRDVFRYRLIRPFIGPTLSRLTMILAQNEVERGRFLKLGAPPGTCYAAGNLKYLKQQEASRRLAAPELGVRSGDRLIVAGSLHDDEIAPVLGVLNGLGLGIRIVIAPRHATGVELAMRHAQVLGRKAKRRSDTAAQEWEILVLDTMGELPQLYALAACAIVGGGFGRHGGHNLFEPVMAGAPVLFGQHFENFASEASILSGATPEAQLSLIKNLADILPQVVNSTARRAAFFSLQSRALPDEATTRKNYLDLLGPQLAGMRI